jgi:hypothetical protein
VSGDGFRAYDYFPYFGFILSRMMLIGSLVKLWIVDFLPESLLMRYSIHSAILFFNDVDSTFSHRLSPLGRVDFAPVEVDRWHTG